MLNHERLFLKAQLLEIKMTMFEMKKITGRNQWQVSHFIKY